MPSPLRRAATILVAIGALACPAAAGAAPTWLAPTPAFGEPEAIEVATAMAPDGTALIARVRDVPAAGGETDEVLEAVIRPPGGSVSAPVEVMRTADVITGPEAFAAPDGSFVLSYYESLDRGDPDDEGHWFALVRPDGSVRGRFNTVADGLPPIRSKPAFDGEGWTYYAQTAVAPGLVDLRVRFHGDDDFLAGSLRIDPPAPPDGATGYQVSGLPALAVTPHGTILYAFLVRYWMDCDDVTELWLSEGTRGGPMGAPRKVTSRVLEGTLAGEACDFDGGALILDPITIVTDAHGAATVAFQVAEYPSAVGLRVEVMHRPVGGQWAREEVPGATSEDLSVPRLWLAGSTPVLTYGPVGLDLTAVQWSARTANGSWRPAKTIAEAALAGLGFMPLADGSLSVVWLDAAQRLMARRGLPDGTLEPATVVASGLPAPPHAISTSVAAAADAAGNGIAVFATGAAREARYAGFDGAGPVLEDVSIPGGGGVFSVGAVRDVWSVVGPPAWTFGDGTGASGTSVSHAFAPGSYIVRVTVTDAVGNATTVSGPVNVPGGGGGPPPPPPPPARDTTAPAFSRGPAVRRGELRFALSERATVVAVVTRKANGVRKRRRCVAPPKRRTTAKRCTRQVKVATLRGTFEAGAGQLRLPRKVRRREGVYTITVKLADAARNTATARVRHRVR